MTWMKRQMPSQQILSQHKTWRGGRHPKVLYSPSEGPHQGRDMDREELSEFSAGSLHLRKNNPTYQYRLGGDLLESSCVEKDLVLVDNNLSMSQQCVIIAKESNGLLEYQEEHCLSCIRKVH
ncbi:hypothetical protein WISP_38711 [Willisornis vidua]|uniref:Uncharacterized protein n=1 Tax=Willisornis vidua TaxID=1566151 RepID=A0ABQ9DNB1_9PASS|nr:hypothetical protein WISP_38711 [Willisornis vidua]